MIKLVDRSSEQEVPNIEDKVEVVYSHSLLIDQIPTSRNTFLAYFNI